MTIFDPAIGKRRPATTQDYLGMLAGLAAVALICLGYLALGWLSDRWQ